MVPRREVHVEEVQEVQLRKMSAKYLFVEKTKSPRLNHPESMEDAAWMQSQGKSSASWWRRSNGSLVPEAREHSVFQIAISMSKRT
jgi:hypothetical protein